MRPGKSLAMSTRGERKKGGDGKRQRTDSGREVVKKNLGGLKRENRYGGQKKYIIYKKGEFPTKKNWGLSHVNLRKIT